MTTATARRGATGTTSTTGTTGTTGAVLDDLDSRPGSATSLLRTVVGSTMRECGGWMSTAALVRLMGAVDVSPSRTRTALSRVRARGLLEGERRDGAAGYALAAAALPMLLRGDRRIHHPRSMDVGDPWCLISFSLPEQERDLRHRLRRRLSWIGCGIVTGALWIAPATLADEVDLIVADLGLEGRLTVFIASEIRGVTEPREAMARWWDLDAIRRLHDAFLTQASHAGADQPDLSPRDAFRAWTTVLDAWRPIPYLDPGLPVEWLPEDWPGHRSISLFLHARDRLSSRAAAYARSL